MRKSNAKGAKKHSPAGIKWKQRDYLLKKCQHQCQQSSSVGSKRELKKVNWSYP
jgi:hypothetical protein